MRLWDLALFNDDLSLSSRQIELVIEDAGGAYLARSSFLRARHPVFQGPIKQGTDAAATSWIRWTESV